MNNKQPLYHSLRQFVITLCSPLQSNSQPKAEDKSLDKHTVDAVGQQCFESRFTCDDIYKYIECSEKLQAHNPFK